jgi:hypothetical protein
MKFVLVFLVEGSIADCEVLGADEEVLEKPISLHH